MYRISWTQQFNKRGLCTVLWFFTTSPLKLIIWDEWWFTVLQNCLQKFWLDSLVPSISPILSFCIYFLTLHFFLFQAALLLCLSSSLRRLWLYCKTSTRVLLSLHLSKKPGLSRISLLSCRLFPFCVLSLLIFTAGCWSFSKTLQSKWFSRNILVKLMLQQEDTLNAQK